MIHVQASQDVRHGYQASGDDMESAFASLARLLDEDGRSPRPTASAHDPTVLPVIETDDAEDDEPTRIRPNPLWATTRSTSLKIAPEAGPPPPPAPAVSSVSPSIVPESGVRRSSKSSPPLALPALRRRPVRTTPPPVPPQSPRVPSVPALSNIPRPALPPRTFPRVDVPLSVVENERTARRA